MKNNIINKDCLDGLKELETASVDLIVTDPPYFLPVNSYVGKRGEGYTKRHLADTSILKGFFKQVFAELFRVLKPTGSIYVFCDGQSYPIFYEVMFPYTKYVRPIIWDKIVSYNGYTWRHQHELIAWGELEDSHRVPTGDGDIIKCRGVLQKNRNHPAEKPVELLKKLIAKHSEAKIVLDPFIGSGSVAVAAIELGKSYIGFELNEKFCEIANSRASDAKPLINLIDSQIITNNIFCDKSEEELQKEVKQS
jgi:site-specific DNA-methyltransferase (adenine-specific)